MKPDPDFATARTLDHVPHVTPARGSASGIPAGSDHIRFADRAGESSGALVVGGDPPTTQQPLKRVHQELHQEGITVSTGTAESAAGSLDAELADLLHQANQEMYATKRPEEPEIGNPRRQSP